MNLHSPISPYVELARAVALANLAPPAPKELRLLTEQDPHAKPAAFVVAYQPFIDELARALREPGPREPDRCDHRIEANAFHVYRPAFGLGTTKAFTGAQLAISELLAEALRGEVAAIHKYSRTVRLRVDVETLSVVDEAEVPGRNTKRLPRPRVQVCAIDVPAPGRDAFVYGIIMASKANLLRRLNRCRTCRRFIVARTERQVRYCADSRCRNPMTLPTREPTTLAAGYQRQRRQRQGRWFRYVHDRLEPALLQLRLSHSRGSREQAITVLKEAIAAGHQLLPGCFPRSGGERRQAAILCLRKAEEEVG